MTAQEAFQSMVKEHVSPLMRDGGFKAANPTWRLRSASGDFAVVNVQKSSWNTQDRVGFYVNLAIVPALWWEYVSQHWGKTPSAPTESYGLLRRRLHPPDDHPLWPHRDWRMHDTTSAQDCGRVLGQQLREVLPDLRTMLDRERLLAFIQNGAKGWWMVPKTELAIGYLIADKGLTPYLRQVLDAFDEVPQQPRVQQQSAWLRQRASSIGDDG